MHARSLFGSHCVLHIQVHGSHCVLHIEVHGLVMAGFSLALGRIHLGRLMCAEAAIQGTSTATFDASKQDPLKAVKGFARAPRKRGHDDEELTEMEVRKGCFHMSAGRCLRARPLR